MAATPYAWEISKPLSKQDEALAFRIDTFFQHKVKYAGFNGSVLVAEKGKWLYHRHFGYQHYGKKIALTDSSLFQIASVTKPVTATAVLQLYERGKIDLDAPVKKFLDSFPYDSITIRMLLNHRSGLPNYIYLFDELKWPPDSFITNSVMARFFSASKPALQATPGKKFQYCNTNYAFLALLIEQVSGLSYEEFLRQNIFEPARMKHTQVVNPETDLSAVQTLGYRGLDWQRVPPVPYDGVVGDKGLYSTAIDLYLFDQALNHGLLLKKETLDEAYRGYSYEKPGVNNYGLGWRLKEFPDGERVVFHNGWWRGYNSLFNRRPDQEVCVIVLSNKYNRTTYQMTPLFDLLNLSNGDSAAEE